MRALPLLAALAFALPASAADEPDIAGFWRDTADNVVLKVERCATAWCGTIVGWAAPVAEGNRARSLGAMQCGHQALAGFSWTGEGWSGGTAKLGWRSDAATLAAIGQPGEPTIRALVLDGRPEGSAVTRRVMRPASLLERVEAVEHPCRAESS